MSSQSHLKQHNNKEKVHKQIQKTRQNKIKSELCIEYINKGKCSFGDKCIFAHGLENILNKRKYPIKSKAECKAYNEIEFCPFGQNCNMTHLNLSENREKTVFSLCRNVFYWELKVNIKQKRLDVLKIISNELSD